MAAMHGTSALCRPCLLHIDESFIKFYIQYLAADQSRGGRRLLSTSNPVQSSKQWNSGIKYNLIGHILMQSTKLLLQSHSRTANVRDINTININNSVPPSPPLPYHIHNSSSISPFRERMTSLLHLVE